MNAPAISRQLLPTREKVGEDNHVRLIEYQGASLVFDGRDVTVFDFFKGTVEGEVFHGTWKIKDEAALVPTRRDCALNNRSEVITSCALFNRISELIRHQIPGKPSLPGITNWVEEPVNSPRVRLRPDELEAACLPRAIGQGHTNLRRRPGIPKGNDASRLPRLLADSEEGVL